MALRLESGARDPAEGKTSKEALRALKRHVSDALYQRMKADARRTAAAVMAGPGGHLGTGYVASVASWHPEQRLFGQATPGLGPTLRPQFSRSKATPCSSRIQVTCARQHACAGHPKSSELLRAMWARKGRARRFLPWLGNVAYGEAFAIKLTEASLVPGRVG